ncbi:MAG TPA: L,D-transpeptidase [Candidatus Polarisedimenticolaceae bacterium]|nr:L,D-transpeptidase [Candidatus Polarisedimenticolaceae bacterium]
MTIRLVRRGKALSVAAVALAVAVLGVSTSGYRYRVEALPLTRTEQALPTETAALQAFVADQRREQARLDRQLRRASPRSTYIVIDRTHNRLQLRRNGETMREATCSAGSGMVLRDEARDREWVFDTPQGRFEVLRKIEDPVWKKPDWAFIEQGQPLPADPGERIEYGVLGEYALYFGDGYMLHGTLYERLLGRSVTHGCVRLGREDLRAVYHNSAVGTPIFIY